MALRGPRPGGAWWLPCRRPRGARSRPRWWGTGGPGPAPRGVVAPGGPWRGGPATAARGAIPRARFRRHGLPGCSGARPRPGRSCGARWRGPSLGTAGAAVGARGRVTPARSGATCRQRGHVGLARAAPALAFRPGSGNAARPGTAMAAARTSRLWRDQAWVVVGHGNPARAWRPLAAATYFCKNSKTEYIAHVQFLYTEVPPLDFASDNFFFFLFASLVALHLVLTHWRP